MFRPCLHGPETGTRLALERTLQAGLTGHVQHKVTGGAACQTRADIDEMIEISVEPRVLR